MPFPHLTRLGRTTSMLGAPDNQGDEQHDCGDDDDGKEERHEGR